MQIKTIPRIRDCCSVKPVIILSALFLGGFRFKHEPFNLKPFGGFVGMRFYLLPDAGTSFCCHINIF